MENKDRMSLAMCLFINAMENTNTLKAEYVNNKLFYAWLKEN